MVYTNFTNFMSVKTNIEWCDSTLNFWSGCTKVSPGCAHCYAEALSNRNLGTVGKWGKGAKRQLHESAFKMAHRLNKKPWICDDCGHAQPQDLMCGKCGKCGKSPHHRRRIFSLSLGDWLDDEVPIEWLARMLDTIRQCDKVTWILCTKRPENFVEQFAALLRMLKYQALAGGLGEPVYWEEDDLDDFEKWLKRWIEGNPPTNIILLTSVENQPMADQRIPALLKIPAACRGLSLEPLLGPVDLLNLLPVYSGSEGTNSYDNSNLSWLILGGESGPGARPCNVDWIRSLGAQGKLAGVATFVKQLGSKPIMPTQPDGVDAVAVLCDKKGGDMSEWPEDLQTREFPFLK